MPFDSFEKPSGSPISTSVCFDFVACRRNAGLEMGMDDIEHWQIDYVGEALGVFGFGAVICAIVAGFVGAIAALNALSATL